LSPQNGRQPPVAEPRPTTHDLPQPAAQRRFVRPRASPIPLRAPRLAQRRARPSLGDLELRLEPRGRRTPLRRAYQFFDATCLSIRMSRAWSATISLSRLFSSSSSFSRLASSDFIPPYWFRQRWYVPSLISSACSTAARSWPAFSIASASRSFFTICSGL